MAGTKKLGTGGAMNGCCAGIGESDGGLGTSCAANSGNDESGCQSPDPAAWAMVCPFTRLSRIQRWTCAESTGPYSFPSPPIILYISPGQSQPRQTLGIFQR